MNYELRLSWFLAVLMVFGLAWLAYYHVPGNGFVLWDTQDYVIYNQHIQALTWDNLWWMLTGLEMSNWHPFTWLSHAIDYYGFQLHPGGHHASGVWLHAGNSLWVLLLSWVLLKTARHGAGNLLAAAITAVLFAVHPLHVESVAWVAERKDVLSLFFGLPVLVAYVFYTQSRRGRYYWYTLAALSYALAVMCKPMVVTWPAVLLLLDVYPLQRFTWRALPRLLLEKLPFILLSAILVVLTVLAQEQGGSISGLDHWSLSNRVLNAAHSVFFYLGKLLLPVNLLPFYPHSTGEISRWPLLAGGGIFVLCAGLWYRGQRMWMILWLFYLLTLAPVLGIVQVGLQAAADRYTYLPTLPFYLLMGMGIAALLRQKLFIVRALTAVLAVTMLAILIHQTRRQSLVWRNSLTLWYYSAAHTPHSALVQANLGAAYMQFGDAAQAVRHFEQAVKLYPSEENYRKLALGYQYAGQSDKQIGIYEHLRRYHLSRGREVQAAAWAKRIQQLRQAPHTSPTLPNMRTIPIPAP